MVKKGISIKGLSLISMHNFCSLYNAYLDLEEGLIVLLEYEPLIELEEVNHPALKGGA